MLTTSKAKYLFIGAVLIIGIGFLVVYAEVASSGSSTNPNASPRSELASFASFLFGGDSGNVNLVSSTDGDMDPSFNPGGVEPTPTPTPVCPGAPGGIISWWPGEGDAQDVVSHYDGTLQNGATFAAGTVGQAFSLDGVDDAIVVNNNAALNPTSITVEAWVKPDSVPTGTLKNVVTKWGFDATIDSYFLGLFNSGGQVRLIGAIGDGATGDSGFSGGTVTLNTWNHIAMTYDAASGLNRLYLNGVQVNQRTRPNGIYATTSRVFIGSEDSGNNRFFSGLVDEPTIYSRSLTEAEILAIYNAGGNGKCGVPTPTPTPTPIPNTNTALSSNANPSVYAQPVTFTATVTSEAGTAEVPTGTVQFYADGNPISGLVDLSDGVAMYTTGALGVGTHSIIATYGGDSNFAGSTSPSLTQSVNKGNTFTQITNHSPSTTVVGQPYTVSLLVGAQAPSVAIPLGTVTVTDATGPNCTASLAEGMGSCIITSTTAGFKALVATYSGDSSFNASFSATTTHRVFPASTSTRIASNLNPSSFGQAVTFHANVNVLAPGAGTPAGRVTFRDGATVLSTVALNSSGQASYITSGLSFGAHNITAIYNGDANFNGSGAKMTQQVKIGTVTSLSSSRNPSLSGQAFNFLATVTAARGAGTPTGNVTFRDGTAVLSTVPLNTRARAAYTTSSLAIGTHSITATYDGDGTFNLSTSPTLIQTVNQNFPIVFSSDRDGNAEIYTMNSDGSGVVRLTFTNNNVYDLEPVWSPDRTKIAFGRFSGISADIHVMNADGSNVRQLTNGLGNMSPTWSPDGTKIAFASNRGGILDFDIYVMNADGSGVTRLTNTPAQDNFPDWSPDGLRIAFSSFSTNDYRTFEVYVMNSNGTNLTRLTNNFPIIDYLPTWSPDGTKIAFTSNRAGVNTFGIYVMNRDGSGVTRITTGEVPSWGANGKIAFELAADIYSINADGTGLTRLTASNGNNFSEWPDW